MTIPAEQQEVADYLSSLSRSPPTETHISAVFIGTDTVWKLKKAVRMPFLDFTTPEAREHFLRRELDLNKPTAPAIYRDIVAVSRKKNGSLVLGGQHAIDWVLRMAPVAAGDFLDVIAENGAMTSALLDALGDCVAAYHQRLAAIPGQDSASRMLDITRGNVSSALAAGLPSAEVEAWHARINDAIEARRDWLAERAAGGCVRRCHGDLHLGNFCLWEGKPVAFDALEFDENLATIDVAYDLAFLLMDLDRRVGRGAANRVMNRYVARTGDSPMFGFPIFLSQRAMIRAHVLTKMRQKGDIYLDVAQTYLKPAPAVVIAIGGLQGTGKSTLARALAPELGPAPGALIVRSDEIRKRLHGANPETRLPPEAYTEPANARTNQAVIEQARLAARSGHSVIVDATFLDLTVRRDLGRTIGQTGIPFIGVWLDAPLTVLEARVASRTGDASDATVAILQQSAKDNPGARDWLLVNAEDGNEALQIMRQAVRSSLPM